MVQKQRDFSGFTPEEKLDLALELYWSARELKKAYLKQKHPDLSDKELENKVRKIFLHAST